MKKSQISNFKSQISSGFTLIELLVVVVIIGVLASFLMANYVGVRMRSRDAQRKSDLAQIQSALELYRSDVGTYPAVLPACGNSLQSPPPVITYMRKIPCDPTNSAPLVYRYRTAYANSAYNLTACLENVNDQQRDLPSNRPAMVDGAASIATCNGTNNWSRTLISP